jgi:hypothetical protein
MATNLIRSKNVDMEALLRYQYTGVDTILRNRTRTVETSGESDRPGIGMSMVVEVMSYVDVSIS